MPVLHSHVRIPTAKDVRQVAWAWLTNLIHSFSFSVLLGQAEGQTIRGNCMGDRVVEMEKGRDCGTPQKGRLIPANRGRTPRAAVCFCWHE